MRTCTRARAPTTTPVWFSTSAYDLGSSGRPAGEVGSFEHWALVEQGAQHRFGVVEFAQGFGGRGVVALRKLFEQLRFENQHGGALRGHANAAQIIGVREVGPGQYGSAEVELGDAFAGLVLPAQHL